MGDILIIEDDPITQKLIHTLMCVNSLNTFLAASAEVALNICAMQQFEIIVVDMLLPDMAGYELIPKIKVMQPDSKIVILSGHTYLEIRDKLKDRGFKTVLEPTDNSTDILFINKMDLVSGGAAKLAALTHGPQELETKQYGILA